MLIQFEGPRVAQDGVPTEDLITVLTRLQSACRRLISHERTGSGVRPLVYCGMQPSADGRAAIAVAGSPDAPAGTVTRLLRGLEHPQRDLPDPVQGALWSLRRDLSEEIDAITLSGDQTAAAAVLRRCGEADEDSDAVRLDIDEMMRDLRGSEYV